MSEDVVPQRSPAAESRAAVGPRMGMATMPVEKSKDFRNSTLRLISWLRPERLRMTLVLAFAVLSVVMSVVNFVVVSITVSAKRKAGQRRR